jgi:uncharacterized protein
LTGQIMGWDLNAIKQAAAEQIDKPAPKLPEGFRAIDAHVHLFPEKLFEAIWKWFDDYGWNVLFKLPVPDLLDYLRRMGVEKAFCLVYAHKAGVAAGLNRWVADLAAREPMVVPFGAFHQDDAPDTVLNEALDTLGLAGIKVHCNVQQARADDPRFFPLYEHLAARGRTLVLHGGTQPVHDAYVGIGNARRALEKYPELRVQLAHMGAGEFGEAFALMADFPNVTMDISIIFNDRFVFFPPELFCDVVRFADRILYGSDFPNIWYPPEAGAAAFLECGFPEDVVRKILYENAMGVPGVA